MASSSSSTSTKKITQKQKMIKLGKQQQSKKITLVSSDGDTFEIERSRSIRITNNQVHYRGQLRGRYWNPYLKRNQRDSGYGN